MLQVTMGLATQGLIAKYETFDKSSTAQGLIAKYETFNKSSTAQGLIASTAHTHQMVQTWTAED